MFIHLSVSLFMLEVKMILAVMRRSLSPVFFIRSAQIAPDSESALSGYADDSNLIVPALFKYADDSTVIVPVYTGVRDFVEKSEEHFMNWTNENYMSCNCSKCKE